MTECSAVEFRDRGCYLDAHDTAVIADLHLGRGHRAGVAAPIETADDLERRLSELLDHWSPARLILAGDVLDAFDTIPPGVTSRLDRLIETIHESGAEPVFLAGNHDTMLQSLVDEVSHTVELDETVVLHGHEHVAISGEQYIVGHQHPALRIEGVKRPCFLTGPGPSSSSVVILPAFSRTLRGTVMNRRAAADADSPFLTTDTFDQFRPIVWDEAAEETLSFPPFGSLRSFL